MTGSEARGDTPLKIGLFVGREWSFPPAFIDEVNGRNDGVIAEYVRIGGTRMNTPSGYRVIIDRISHEVPYYRSYLKNAALQGAKVINDPFMWTADDKFFEASLATAMGVPHPKTVVLPNHSYVPGIVPTESLRNLEFVDWNETVEYCGGFPVVLKDAHGGGWKEVYVCRSMDELWYHYNQTGLLTMILQEYIAWDDYARCYCLGQETVHVMRYKPGLHGTAVYYDDHGFSDDLYNELVTHCLRLCQALGYDMNALEFAIKDGVPYIIDFMNPAPDMDINSLGERNFRWMVEHMADMAIKLAKSDASTRDRYQWARGLTGSPPAETP